MCFSAEASFVTGAALVPAGVYCVRMACRKNTGFVPLALVPLGFAMQQCSEGFVWLGLAHNDAELVRQSSEVYLFFALAFWPFWIPFSLLIPETRRQMRRTFACLVALSSVWFWLYYPIAAHFQGWVSAEIVQHSIRYDLDGLPAFQVAPRLAWRLGYLVAICLPLALGRFGGGEQRACHLAGGLLVAVLFTGSYLLYWYAFTSVWCFFAALLSLLLCYLFFRLPPAS